jgi:hypothetical protein
MNVRFFVLIGLFLSAFAAEAQQAREMIRPIGPDQARRLEEYNSIFLQEVLYSAARYRIVAVNANLMLQEEPITITPFEDMEPIVVTPERVRRTDYAVNWLGRIQVDPRFETSWKKYYASISMNWWDVNDLGNAELSGANTFKFSPAWRIDENERPVLGAPPAGIASDREVGRPPQTAEEIAEHKRLLQLDRYAFASFDARLSLPSGETYVLTPLRYTPRYSIVYEVDEEKVVPVPFEPGDEVTLTNEQKGRVEQYEQFMSRLPREENKAIRGDIE